MAQSRKQPKPVRMRVKKVALDDSNKRVIVYLATPKRTLPIIIGMFEGQAIVSAMRGAEPPGR